MKKEKNGEAGISACDKNLKRTAFHANRDAEKRSAYIYEKMREFYAKRDGAFFEKLPETYREVMRGAFSASEGPTPFAERLEYDGRVSEIADLAEGAAYLQKIAGYGSFPSLYFGSETEKIEGGRIAYFKNPLTDAAFSVFSGRIDSPSVFYAHDLSSVCEEVYYERCPYGILPLSNTKDGRLAGFYGLINKYELYAVSVCEIYSRENDTATRFALLSKDPEFDRDVSGKKTVIEFRVPHGKALFEILCAASYFGLENTGIDSLPAEMNASDLITLCGDGEKVCGFMFYMYCTAVQYTLIGVWSV